MRASPDRFTAIDELRAVAIFSMMVAHFGPGIFIRAPQIAHMSGPVLVWGRLATVAFIVVFGITIGFVHFGRYVQGRDKQVVSSVLERAILVLICAFLIQTPDLIDLYLAGEQDFWRWVFSMYSVLNYYTLALLSVPFWLYAIRKNPLQRSLVLGVSYWLVGTIVLHFWSGSSLGWSEWVRLHLVSGPFAYFQMSGAAILAIPLGILLRKAVVEDALGAYIARALALGSLLAVAGLAWGLSSHELSMRGLVDGSLKTPPRLWYWAMFGGLTIVLLGVLVGAHRSVPHFASAMFLVALFGQSSLPIYTAHKWVLPMMNWMDHWVVVEGVARIGFGFGLFGVFCATVMYYYQRKNRGKRATAIGRPTLAGEL